MGVWVVVILLAKGKQSRIYKLATFQGVLLVPFLILGTIPYSDRLLLPFWLFLPVTLASLCLQRVTGQIRVVILMICVSVAVLVVGLTWRTSVF
jgi:hypothetical protein